MRMNVDDIDNFDIFQLVENDCYSLFDIVLTNLDLYNFHVNTKNEQGNTLLHLICKKGNYRYAKKLIKMGSDVNITNNMKESPLHAACTSGNSKLVKLLLENDARTTLKDKNSESPAFATVKNGHVNVLDCLSTDPNEINGLGENLLHVAVKTGNEAIIDRLLRSGKFDLNARTDDGSTVIHLAVNDVDLVKKLTKNGCDPTVIDAKCRNLLHLAVERRNFELCQALIELGVDVNGRDINGSTPLHVAVDLQLMNVAFLLIRSGAEVNGADCDGYTPLHVACTKSGGDLVRFLLRNNAVNDVRTFNGDSPLHLAASTGNCEAVAVLLNEGLKAANNLNKDDYSPVQLAEINGHGKVLDCFRQLSKIPRAVRPAKSIWKVPTARASICL